MVKNRRKINIGIDIDGIFVGKPPLIPALMINKLYMNTNSKELDYRIPKSWMDRKIRRLSHISMLRPIITKNIIWLNTYTSNKNTNVYIVSGRYSFLYNLTKNIFKKNCNNFDLNKIILNNSDIQPHIFKSECIKKFKLNYLIDDDIFMLKYLARKHPNVTFFWYSGSPYFKKNRLLKQEKRNIFLIKSLDEIVESNLLGLN